MTRPRSSARSVTTQPATGAAPARRSPALVIAEDAGDVAEHAVRRLSESPTGAAFGAAQAALGAVRGATRAARSSIPSAPARRGERAIARSISRGPNLVIEPELFFTGMARSCSALVVSDADGHRGER